MTVEHKNFFVALKSLLKTGDFYVKPFSFLCPALRMFVLIFFPPELLFFLLLFLSSRKRKEEYAKKGRKRERDKKNSSPLSAAVEAVLASIADANRRRPERS